MILMAVLPVVGQHQIRRRIAFQPLEDLLDLGTLVRKETVTKMLDADAFATGSLQKHRGAPPGFLFPFRVCRKYHPVDLNLAEALNQAEEQSAAPDLDVVGMRPQA